jgi:hypothetical protein
VLSANPVILFIFAKTQMSMKSITYGLTSMLFMFRQGVRAYAAHFPRPEIPHFSASTELI